MFIKQRGGFEQIVSFANLPERAGARIMFALRSEKGAVNFTLEVEHLGFSSSTSSRAKINSVDIGYHSYTPLHPEDFPITNSCELLDFKPCYYDGSGVASAKGLDILLVEGADALFDYLEKFHGDVFV